MADDGSHPSQFRFWRLTREDAETAGALLERAFHATPLFVRFLPHAESRSRFCQELFTFAIRYGCQLGEAWAVGPREGEMAGVAFWIARPEPEWTPEMTAELGFDRLEAEWGSLLHELHAPVKQAGEALAGLPKPWRYLDMIGVDPRWQGQGFGGALLRKMLDDAAAAGAPVGLITDNPNNVSFYAHRGFDIAWKGVSPDGTLSLWAFRAGGN
jgi:GNAT superfamily N-acetyltransferase